MTPETLATVLDKPAGQRADAAANLRRIQIDREARGLDPREGAAVGAMESDINRIDAAVAELEAPAPPAPSPGAIVVSKTQALEDGSERTVHYFCGDQRATREEALADLKLWCGLSDRIREWNEARYRLDAVGFSPDLAGLDGLVLEWRRLYDALTRLYLAYEAHTTFTPEQYGAMECAHEVGLWCWLACPDNYAKLADSANREGGAE